ncbi:MAG: NADH-quinone oxidoreductase subunit I [Deltaproteobacteria bacterium]|jgi:NADH-quinone oxidoreductase subunit I|uniref:NuoI/complex I 23 kDa subunit family protein n=1 Tax=Hydrosulfovibrio ferrireducens TaxID=2934181 RepID=UPI00121BAB72|nr:NADH-quinone oxidoreductase subunit I [Desulfobulbaceae bacterium]MDP2757078.1 NADH-quinone oxidoreductase subunit I [Desulfurivibrionaceae bacterium]TDB36227.1 MAG: NADH-quinone oxidoreductase subunit I [Deltaproteobacteria bacterium]
MIDYLREIISGTWSLFVGLGITIRYFFQPVVTVQYPHQTLPMTPRFRGHIELVKDEETGETKCIVCGMCQKACPSNCITVNGEKREGVKGKVLTEYTLDFTKCSLCGLCVESCPTAAITFSKDYNLAGVRKEAYIFDLKKRLEAKN